MALETFETFTVKDLRDYGYYVDAGENLFIPTGANASYTTFSIVTAVIFDGTMIVLESVPFEDGISMFAAIEETRGYPADTIIAYRDFDNGQLVPVTSVEHDEIGRAVNFF